MRLSLSSSLHLRHYLAGFVLLLMGGLAQADGVPGQGTWETTLQPRDLDGNGVTDAYYDTVLDITWLADANHMDTSAWDVSQADGGWDEEEFADYLAGFGHLGVITWRLPAVNNTNQGATGGELAHMYAVTLGNLLAPNPGAGLVNTGPFSNLQADCYLYGTGVYIGGLGGEVYANAFSMTQAGCAHIGLAWVVADGDVVPVAAPAPAYEIVDLGTLGGVFSAANDINNNGQIVGSARNAGNQTHAFLYAGGTMQDLGTLMPDNSGNSSAIGINNLGDITGYAAVDAPLSSGLGVGFLYTGGLMTALGALPATYSDGYIASGAAINDSGEIAINYYDPNLYDTRFGVRAADGNLSLDTRIGYAIAINSAGHAIGSEQNFGFEEKSLLFANNQFYVIGNDYEDTSGGSLRTINFYDIADGDRLVGSYLNRSCGSNFCDPDEAYGRITAADVLPLTSGSHTKALGTRAIHMTNAAGDMAGKYANRWIVRPAGGANYFVDDIADTTGWNWATAQLRAMNDQGDIVGSATTSGGQTHALLLRKLGVVKTVAIDIDPFSGTNEVLPNSDNLIAVAILSTNVVDGDAVDFDATQVDPASLKFGVGEAPNIALPWAVDVGGDGDTDVLFAFGTQAAAILCGDTEVGLTGETYAGELIAATDTITTSDCESTGCHP